MDNLQKIRNIIAELESTKKCFLSDLRGIIRKKFIKCVKCGKRSRLSRWTFIQKQFNKYSPGNKETVRCAIECPECGYRAHLNTHPQRERIIYLIDAHPFSTDDLFKKVEKRLE